MEYTIKKRVAIVWGNFNGHPELAKKVTAWEVFDVNDKMVYGGVITGSNWEVGYASVPTKREAKEWVSEQLAIANNNNTQRNRPDEV
jgi:hypothetical protein